MNAPVHAELSLNLLALLRKLMLLLFLVTQEHRTIFGSCEEELLRSLEDVTVLTDREQEEAKADHNDFCHTAKVTQKVDPAVNTPLVRLLLGLEPDD